LAALTITTPISRCSLLSHRARSDAGFAGQSHVAQDQVGHVVAQILPHLGRVGRRLATIAMGLKDPYQEPAYQRLVFDDQDLAGEVRHLERLLHGRARSWIDLLPSHSGAPDDKPICSAISNTDRI
jgi:hypothetical protein